MQTVQYGIRLVALVGVVWLIHILVISQAQALTQEASGSAATHPLAVAVDLGIGPESMALAGVSTADVIMILSRIDDAEELRSQLAAAVAGADAAQANVLALQSQLQAGTLTEAIESSLTSAQASVSSYQSLAASLRDTLFAVVMDGLPLTQVQHVQAYRNSAAWNVPLEYRAVDRTPDQWRAIATAVTARARAQRLNQPLATEHAELLAAVEAEPAVTAAAAALPEAVPALQSQFQTLLSGIVNPPS